MSGRKTRIRRVALWIAGVGALGLGYALVCIHSAFRVPCVFTAVTGWACPGCGVTRMCLALLRLDFAAAWQTNPVVLLCVPVVGWVMGTMAWRYVQTGITAPTKGQSRLLWVLVVVLVCWGVWRNVCP